ncbi:piggyBac transposable element-derived protein 3-like [Aphis craccivora]|uniref:PiggyBac transposable element-derived protein 3-like n=1 Tax=Aphis craccivora TaxID=307492 RepID=A0A6G0YCI1_APHCR|nr:piggyBac transposable element-derived protein 3-like [Aphis craccivora]
MKRDRGYSEECFTVVEDVPISAVTWKDNKIVHITSTFVGELDKNVVTRFDNKKKTTILIPRLKIIEFYNKHMGGVDLMDSMIGRYRIIMKSKKWCMKKFYHMVDMTIVNAWLLYKPGLRGGQEGPWPPGLDSWSLFRGLRFVHYFFRYRRLYIA